MKIDRFYSAREKATYPLSAFSLILILSLLLRSNVPPVNRGHPLNDQSEACNYVSEATWMCVLRGNICRDVRLNFKFHFYVPI